MDSALAAQIVELSQHGEDGQAVADDLAASHGVSRHVKRTITRRRIGQYGKEFCDLNIEIRTNGELSITGTMGYVLTPRQARRQALDDMTSWLEEEDNLRYLNQRNGKNFRSPARAAKFVLNSDGEYHGLDVVRDDEKEVFIATSCGQIRDDIEAFFPEAVPLFAWHLNHMRSNCVHQEARGEDWSNEKDREKVCGDCGFKLGAGWAKRTLPAEIIKLALEIK